MTDKSLSALRLDAAIKIRDGKRFTANQVNELMKAEYRQQEDLLKSIVHTVAELQALEEDRARDRYEHAFQEELKEPSGYIISNCSCTECKPLPLEAPKRPNPWVDAAYLLIVMGLGLALLYFTK